ncbi:GNAT family N-acetyltransferase [Actinoplanes teichomyceticus]|uniref:Acetyltransferase (GNAT) family protein n=1 Tax=Actinoplanes teichomyceticus TaxID=1867 RepID=A0A561VM95_ACTTI|nr:GNAT family N-acetyltransferase [Actinoplanes teichomyceticus]TWG12735.1 acetyltransferase (GNAT) family protein [Actinoplanes teichomyceticus]GIF13468.1 hypothetical protein Ate01nite_35000 [Actinoplanes teichomyceticus]
MAATPPHLWLYGLHVAAVSRRAGIGRALVRAAENVAHGRGARQMTLDVDAGEAGAITLYEALGYTVVRHHDRHWRPVDRRTAAVVAEGVPATLIMRRSLRDRSRGG